MTCMHLHAIKSSIGAEYLRWISTVCIDADGHCHSWLFLWTVCAVLRCLFLSHHCHMDKSWQKVVAIAGAKNAWKFVKSTVYWYNGKFIIFSEVTDVIVVEHSILCCIDKNVFRKLEMEPFNCWRPSWSCLPGNWTCWCTGCKDTDQYAGKSCSCWELVKYSWRSRCHCSDGEWELGYSAPQVMFQWLLAGRCYLTGLRSVSRLL